MQPAHHTLIALALSLTASLAAAQSPAPVATPIPIPKLDLAQFTTPWYSIARYPVKREKHCLGDEMVLYALGDKRNTFQIVTSCGLKDNNSDSWNATGKLDPAATGRLKLRRLLILSSPYWVLATGPAYEWALVGTPNRKSLWILAHTATLPPDTLAAIKATAAAQGFDTSRLIPISQHL